MIPLLGLIGGKTAEFLGGIGIKVAIAGFVALGGIAFYYHYQALKSDLALEKANNQVLHGTIDAQKMVIDDQQNSMRKMQQITNETQKRFTAAEKAKNDLAKRLNSSNLKDMALKDPKLTQDKVNRGTAYALRCNEIVTGDAIRPEDAGNTICPELVGTVVAPTPVAQNPQTKSTGSVLNKFKKAQ